MSKEILKHGFDVSKFAEALAVVEAINAGNACVSIQKIEYFQRCRNGVCQEVQPAVETQKM